MARLRRWVLWAALLPIAFPWLVATAVWARRDSAMRRRRGDRPRLVYGPIPIVSIKYMSEAMRQAGYETLTLVHEIYAIHGPADFDRVVDSFSGPPGGRSILARLRGRTMTDYAAFAWLLRHYDVFHFFFDGGFLRRTPLRLLEVQLLHLAGKKVIAMPYGSDVAIPSQIQSVEWRDGLLVEYPDLGRNEARRQRWIDYFCARADYVVACLVHFETLPRWDLLPIHYYPIDTDAWAPRETSSGHDGRSGSVVVLHAPNHRALKGTDALLKACEELQDEGCQVSLRLLERVPNDQVHREMERADIVADQFILGYALTAMEGMSLEKPVLSNLSDDRYYARFRNQTRLGDCPIVSTTPSDLKETLRRLVTQPALRAEIGTAGRRYVIREHSYAAMAHLWDAIYRRVWYGEDIDPGAQLRA
jgi:glycosyltransferase involved in cell wall biosynthesis